LILKDGGNNQKKFYQKREGTSRSDLGAVFHQSSVGVPGKPRRTLKEGENYLAREEGAVIYQSLP